MPADPVVSPADTIRAAIKECDLETLQELSPIALDALAALLAVGERDKAEIERLRQELMRCGSLAVSDRIDGCVPKGRALRIRQLVYRFCWPEDAAEADGCHADEYRELVDAALLTERERDRRQIARLTEALAAFFVEFDGDVGMYAPTDETEAKMRAAVLAGEEDARPDVPQVTHMLGEEDAAHG